MTVSTSSIDGSSSSHEEKRYTYSAKTNGLLHSIDTSDTYAHVTRDTCPAGTPYM